MFYSAQIMQYFVMAVKISQEAIFLNTTSAEDLPSIKYWHGELPYHILSYIMCCSCCLVYVYLFICLTFTHPHDFMTWASSHIRWLNGK